MKRKRIDSPKGGRKKMKLPIDKLLPIIEIEIEIEREMSQICNLISLFELLSI